MCGTEIYCVYWYGILCYISYCSCQFSVSSCYYLSYDFPLKSLNTSVHVFIFCLYFVSEILQVDKHQDDDPMIQLESDLIEDLDLEKSSLSFTSEGCGLTTWLQAVLYHYVVSPIVKARYFVLGNTAFNHSQ